jgi:hypothetical protein
VSVTKKTSNIDGSDSFTDMTSSTFGECDYCESVFPFDYDDEELKISEDEEIDRMDIVDELAIFDKPQ